MVSPESTRAAGEISPWRKPSPRALFVAFWSLLVAIKLGLAARLDLFADEAFYRLEAFHPALGYSDLPPLTAWLGAISMSVFGDNHLALRLPFLLLGSAVPWLVLLWAARFPATAPFRWQAALLACLLPLAGQLGIFALPDVPLTVAMLLSAIALDRALEKGHSIDWLLLGVALAIGWLSHYRFVFWYAAGALWLIASGPREWRRSGFWIAQIIGLMGLLPSVLFNSEHAWSALRFQFVDRHPWQWHADGLLDPAWQALIATPPLFIAMIFAMVVLGRSARADNVRARAAAFSSVGLLVLVWTVGLFADSLRSRFHWTLPAWLLILPWAAAWIPVQSARVGGSGFRRLVASLSTPVAATGLSLALICLTLMAGGVDRARYWRAPLPDNLLGWREVAAWVDALRVDDADTRLVADNFVLAAELDDQLHQPVATLDHRLNQKHGRSAQLALWRRDESSLRDWDEGEAGWLVAEPGALAVVDWAAWQMHFCSLFAQVELRSELVVPTTRDRWVAYRVSRNTTGAGRRCALAPVGRLDYPASSRPVTAGASVEVAGWVFLGNEKIRALELALGNGPRTPAIYGLARPDVPPLFAEGGPADAAIGFRATLDARHAEPGVLRVRGWAVTGSGREVGFELPQGVELRRR